MYLIYCGATFRVDVGMGLRFESGGVKLITQYASRLRAFLGTATRTSWVEFVGDFGGDGRKGDGSVFR